MMSQGGSSSHNFNSDENAGESATQNEQLKGYEKSQLRAMVAETVSLNFYVDRAKNVRGWGGG